MIDRFCGVSSLLILTLLTMLALAQRPKPEPVRPVRIALTFEGSEGFDNQLRDELTMVRPFVFVSQSVDFDIYVTVGPITAGDKTIGYMSAVAVVRVRSKDKPIRVMAIIGPTLSDTAKRTARRLDEEFSQKR